MRQGAQLSEHTAGRLKGMGAPWRDESAPEAEKEQAIVDAGPRAASTCTICFRFAPTPGWDAQPQAGDKPTFSTRTGSPQSKWH